MDSSDDDGVAAGAGGVLHAAPVAPPPAAGAVVPRPRGRARVGAVLPRAPRAELTLAHLRTNAQKAQTARVRLTAARRQRRAEARVGDLAAESTALSSSSTLIHQTLVRSQRNH